MAGAGITRFDTAGDLINQATLEMGLGKIQDPFASTDPMWQQLCAMIACVGQDLCMRNDWSHLRSEWKFTTAQGDTGIYPLPADWIDMVPQSGWNRTNRLPLGGPLTTEEWQFLKAWQMNITFTVLFRRNTNELWLYPQPPPVGATIAMEYRSSSWVIPNGVNPGNYNTLGIGGSDTPNNSGDICLFDPQLIVKGLKLEFKTARGFDNAAEKDDFDRYYDRVLARADSAPVLSLNGPRMGIPADRLIGNDNIPITGINGAH